MSIINVFIMLNNKTNCLHLHSTTTIFEMRQKINKKLKIINGNYYLQFCGKSLDNENLTIADYKIYDCSSVNMNFRIGFIPLMENCYQVFIKNDKSHVIFIPKDIKIINLKEIINIKLKIPKEHYYLHSSGKILDDNNNIQDYDIVNESTIHLVYRSHKNMF